jgi:hypothetical protein
MLDSIDTTQFVARHIFLLLDMPDISRNVLENDLVSTIVGASDFS